MNNYYLIRVNPEPEAIGVTNGIKQAAIKRESFADKNNYDYLMKNLGGRDYWAIHHLVKQMKFNLEYVELLPKAIRTDFLLFGPLLINCPFLISSKISNIFDEVNLHNVIRFPAVVVDRDGKKHPYELPHIEPMSDELIDFCRTVFYTGSPISGKKYFTFSSAEDLRNLPKKYLD